MNRRETLACWLVAIGIGSALFVVGFFTSQPALPFGVAINTIASIVCLFLMRPYRTPFVREFFLLSLGAVLISTLVFQLPRLIITYLIFWLVFLFPFTVLGAAISDRYNASRLARVLLSLTATSVVFAFMLLTMFNITYRELEEPPIQLTTDMLADKNPAYVDAPAFWKAVPRDHTGETDFQQGKSRFTMEINKSGAVIALDMAAVEADQAIVGEQRFATYSDAVDYLEANDLPWVPSVQMVDQKVKVFSDAAYAAIDKYTQREAARLGGGRQVFLEGLLKALLANNTNEATAFVGTALTLSGTEPTLPPDVAARASEMKTRFLADQFASKPVGFYAENEALRRVFQQNRFCQQNLLDLFDLSEANRIASDIARVLDENAALATSYDAILALQARTTNPPDEGFVGLKGYTTETLQTDFHIALFPPSGSVENALYEEIYQGQQILPNENIMNRLIRAIQDGEVDLTPDAHSGWYDYQIHALETLLVPEAGPEGEKLLLSKAYKERLIEAFQTILTKQRELHVGHLLRTENQSAYDEETEYTPDITVEPTATCYLRSARALRFLETAVTAILGKEGYTSITLGSGEKVADALPPVTQLLYGLYFQVCDDIGIAPELLPEELTPTQITEAHDQAKTWLNTCGEDPVFNTDVRYIVSVMIDAEGNDVRYWMTTGIRLLKVKAEYAREPYLRLGEKDYPPGYSGIDFVPYEFYIPIEEFAEATGSNVPYTRAAFRELCDRAGSREAIIRAVETGRLRFASPGRFIVFIGLVLIVAGTVLTIRRRS